MVKTLLPGLLSFSFFFYPSPPRPPRTAPLLFLTHVCSLASPVLPSPASSRLCPTCLHLAVQFTRKGCVTVYLPPPPSPPSVSMAEGIRRYTCACTQISAMRSMLAVMSLTASRTHYHSESEPSVGTPPPSALQRHQPRAAAACLQRRRCWYYGEQRWGLGGGVDRL